MKTSSFLIFIASFIVSLLLTPNHALAWGADGHQSVGAIADALIKDTKAGQRVKALLGENTLEQMSVWADCVKGIAPEKDFAYTSAGRFPECAFLENPAAIAAMADYAKRNHSDCKPAFDEESCHKQYHYTNLALQHNEYKQGRVGSNDRDVVHAISAAIMVLQGKPAPAPFNIKDQREAVLMLAHLVGDIHQPLHVGSVYLNAEGKQTNPDEGNYDRGTHTVGGNALQCPCGNLHALWDDIPVPLKRGKGNEVLIQKAKTVAKTNAPIEQWSTWWANDALRDAKIAFASTQFSASTPNQRGNSWSIALPLEYEKTMAKLKEDAMVRAGAHLAQIFTTVWPE